MLIRHRGKSDVTAGLRARPLRFGSFWLPDMTVVESSIRYGSAVLPASVQVVQPRRRPPRETASSEPSPRTQHWVTRRLLYHAPHSRSLEVASTPSVYPGERLVDTEPGM